ncbi:MAG TPA: shikimate dehydrogenase [Burkholderiales bacterium]|nr:shikimate dehydrogenase [Burkholderiales bacterium]
MTDLYAVIGNPVGHSKSPAIHAEFAKQTGQDMDYRAILSPLDGFPETVESLRREGFRGCNVTVPFKFEAFTCSNSRSERAEIARAVNTLKFEEGRVYGDNTDGAGLVADIRKNLQVPIENKRILLAGAGGAAWGVLFPLLMEMPASLVISNRTIAKAEEAVRILSKIEKRGSTSFSAMAFDKLAGSQFDIVINATSSGLKDELPLLPEGLFPKGSLAYDMMYGRKTPFMKFAEEQGASIVSDGLGMLVEQAAESFFVWRGVRPETKPVIDKLR